MTWLPVYNAFCLGLFLISAIFWQLWGILLFFIVFSFSTLYLWLETTFINIHFVDGYWLFILSEFIVFVSLLTSCLWFYESEFLHLSHASDIPLFGCFLLLSSSISVTAYHHELCLNKKSSLNLLVSILLGVGFVFLQGFEFYECSEDILNSSYHASCFCTVGLHFSHVVIGLILLSGCLSMGVNTLGIYYSTTIIWYWHFVDYIWLLVYLVVYIC
uniref:Cytochrome c oxidase subunit 3 n=1 Tax=Megalobenedenia derzhavini TaxID=3068300 RepID=A0AA49KPX7_9PLAT|nr:cytochrome c oxidase subunit III [Megalobenedenia derzhavini]WLG31378.1 cytochrome c oxidase subunit III [Megalobenedenia derzhavini]